MGNQMSSQGNEDAFGISTQDNNNNKQSNNPNNPKNGGDRLKNRENIMMKDSVGSGFFKDNSSYRGVKTDMSSQSGHSIEKQSTNEITDTSVNGVNGGEKTDMKEIKIPTAFEWREGGTNVYLTGSFCNWNQKFLMTQVNTKFEITLDLHRSVYEYKFIVDSKWKFSKHHPTCNDGKGNVNNIIDTTNYVLLLDKKEKENVLKQNEENVKNKSFKEKKSISDFNCEIPSKKDLHVDATSCPDNYKDIFNMDKNSHQTTIGKKEYLEFSDKGYNNENTSFQSISIPTHVNLNHLSLRSMANPLTSGVLVTCATQRDAGIIRVKML